MNQSSFGEKMQEKLVMWKEEGNAFWIKGWLGRMFDYLLSKTKKVEQN